MKRLIACLAILMLISGALATSTSITIYGTNKSNAQDNVTCYGCNNTISVQAWNTSYVKNITVESKNGTGGDVVSFNISNVTAFQVQELKVNKTAVNAYQAGANGMLNFSYTIVGNKTLVLSPAQNINGYNMTWIKVWNGIFSTMTNKTATNTLNTVYQNGNKVRNLAVSFNMDNVAANSVQIRTGTTNPPTNRVTNNQGLASNSVITSQTAMILPNEYYTVAASINSGGMNLWIEWE